MTAPDYDNEHRQEYKNIIDLCCYGFGLALCLFLMWIFGTRLFETGWSSFVDMCAFALLTFGAGTAFLAIIGKLKMLV